MDRVRPVKHGYAQAGTDKEVVHAAKVCFCASLWHHSPVHS